MTAYWPSNVNFFTFLRNEVKCSSLIKMYSASIKRSLLDIRILHLLFGSRALTRTCSARSGAPCIREFYYLCIPEILVLTKLPVSPFVGTYVPTLSCKPGCISSTFASWRSIVWRAGRLKIKKKQQQGRDSFYTRVVRGN